MDDVESMEVVEEHVMNKDMQFLKRDAMSKLHEWYSEDRAGNVLWVIGLKHTGKTTLVKQFIDEVFGSTEGI